MQTFRIVWLLRNLTYDGELCLCDGKNAAFFLPSLAVAGKHGKRHAMTARISSKLLLIGHSLETISDFGTIAYLA